MAEVLSNKLAIKELEERIKDLQEELQELENAISNLNVVQKKLTKDYSAKKVYLKNLENQKATIESLSESYGSEKLDEKSDLINSKIEEAEKFLESTKDVKKNLLIKMQRNKTSKAIEKLQNKKGKIEARQKKIVDKSLAAEIKKSSKTKETKNEIVDNYYGFKIGHTQNKIEKIEEKKESYSEQIENAENVFGKIAPTISKIGSNVPLFASRMEAKVLEKTVQFLKSKNNRLEGLKQLPSNLSLKLREKISQSMHSIADNLSKTK